MHLYCYCREKKKSDQTTRCTLHLQCYCRAHFSSPQAQRPSTLPQILKCKKKKILYLVTLYSKCTRAQRHSTLPQILKSKRRKLKRQRPNSSTLTTCLLSQNRGGFFVLELSACWRVFATIWHRSGSRVSGLGFWVSGLVLRSACWRELATVWHSFLFFFLGAEQLCAQRQACS